MSVADDHVLVGAADAAEAPVAAEAALAAEGTDRPRGTRDISGPPPWIWPTGYALAGVLLFLCYLKMAGTVPVTSDGGNNAMQAWDFLHGNWLLRGWVLGDASYYTTELPQYVLLEIVLGLSPALVHVATAMTYTLVVILAGLLAKGDKTGKEGLIRVAIASVIMIAPQLGAGTFELLGAPDHFGTSVPLLLTFLVLDRALVATEGTTAPGLPGASRVSRHWVPAVVGLMLVWGQIGDRTVITLGVLPIVVVFGARAYRDIVQRREPAIACWFDLALVASAVISVGVADAIGRIISDLGGYRILPVNDTLAPSTSWPGNLAMTADAVLRLFGASFNYGPTGIATALALVHLVGVALAVWALCRVIRRFFGYDDMIAMTLAVAVVIQVTAYAVSTLPYNYLQAHEIATVLPFGAVLAARVLTGRLIRARLLPVLTLVACGYLAALAHGVVQPAVAANDQPLAGWLVAHHYTAGVGSYADDGAIEIDSHGAITMALPSFHSGYATRGTLFEQTTAEFNPRLHYANFVISTKQYGSTAYITPKTIYGAFGRPARIYHYKTWTIMVWNKNLLNDFR
jgi:hypothetical protein